MQKTVFVKDFEVNTLLQNELFVVKALEKKIASNRNPFINAELADKTGTIKGIKFDCSDFPDEGEFVEITGSVSMYQDKLNLRITDFTKHPNPSEDIIKDIIPGSKYKSEDLENWFNLTFTWLEKQGAIYKYFLSELFTENIKAKFLEYPAAISMHGNWLRGLIEHTMNVYLMTENMCKLYKTVHYPELNQELTLLGAFIHDYGKLFEYSVKGVKITKTDLASTLGHITMLNMKIETAWDKIEESLKIDENRKFKNDLMHIISAHHGNLKWGSPVNPQTPEALIVHQADLADSRLVNYTMGKTKGWE